MSVNKELIKTLEKYPFEVKEEIRRQVTADTYRHDLFALAKYGLGYSKIEWSTHGELIEALEEPTTRKLICFPRGGFKSTIAVICYSIWLLIRNPNLRILIDSELLTNSRNFLAEIKGHLESRQMIDLFGSFKSRVNWDKETITIQQRSRPRKEASITCGGVGTTKVGQHYDVIIGDDYNSNKNSDTPEKCQKIVDHYKYNLSILEPDGIYVLIGTRYAELDIIGWILREQLGLDELSEGKLPEKGLIREDKNV